MKIRTLTVLFAIMILFVISPVLAQEKANVPEEQLGFGMELNNDNWIGLHGIYALSQDMHIGAHFGFMFDGGTSIIASTTNLLLAPYFRMYLPKIAKSLRPFGELRFVLNTGTKSVANPNDPNNQNTQSFTETAVKINLGGEWFPYPSVGVYGAFQFFDFGLDPTRIKIGLGTICLGIEWFMDR